MTTVYLNNEYLPIEKAAISPMDRGFLFGDGIYEVIPVHGGKLIGFDLHMQRMQQGLGHLVIESGLSNLQWREVCTNLIAHHNKANLAIYLQVSRGADIKRFHAYPENIEPTVFAFSMDIPNPCEADREKVVGMKVSTATDLRWQRCHIKSTALLGNIMHFQHGYKQGNQETLLFNQADELTEGSAVNVFVIKDGGVSTPPANNHILAGITRHIVLDILRQHSDIQVEEKHISRQDVMEADEIWITSSTKSIAPVTEVDGKPVADGNVGSIWQQAQQLFLDNRFKY